MCESAINTLDALGNIYSVSVVALRATSLRGEDLQRWAAGGSIWRSFDGPPPGQPQLSIQAAGAAPPHRGKRTGLLQTWTADFAAGGRGGPLSLSGLLASRCSWMLVPRQAEFQARHRRNLGSHISAASICRAASGPDKKPNSGNWHGARSKRAKANSSGTRQGVGKLEPNQGG
jgi:hypothetical protein